MSKLPAFQFYPSDWRSDPGVQSLDYFDRGVWFEILCLMHESSERGKLLLNGKPMPTEALARVLGLDKQKLSSTLTTLLDFGIASTDEATGALICRRMVRDEEIRSIRAKAGKMGGNPVLLNQTVKQNASKTQAKPKQTVKQNPTPSSSSSSSSSFKEENNIDVSIVGAPQDAPPTPKRASRLPDTFMLTQDMRKWARERTPEIDVITETEKFVNHWRAKAGKDATKHDWIATWRNWMLKAEDFRHKGNGTPKPKLQSVEEVVAEREKAMQIGARPGQ